MTTPYTNPTANEETSQWAVSPAESDLAGRGWHRGGGHGSPPPPALAARVQSADVRYGQRKPRVTERIVLFCCISFHFLQLISTFQNKRIRLLVDFLKGDY